MILRFKDPEMTRRFVRLCQQHNLHGVVRKVEGWEHVEVTADPKQWKKLIARWADVSVERI